MPYNPWSGVTLVTSPTADPVSVADAKSHSRIYQEADDSLLSAYIRMATNSCQNRCRRAFMPQTWRLSLNQFPGRSPAAGYRSSTYEEYYRENFIKLPYPPLRSIIAFQYMDTNGNLYYMTQSFGVQVGNYLLDTSPDPGRVNLPFSGIWPTTILFPTSAINITFGCGYPAYSLPVQVSVNGVATFASAPLIVTAITGPTLIGNSTLWTAILTTSSDLSNWQAGQSAVFASTTDPAWAGQHTIVGVSGGSGGGTITISGRQSLISPLPSTFSALGSGTLTAAFDPGILGTWVTLTVAPDPSGSPGPLTGSYNAAGLSADLTTLQLMVQQPSPISLAGGLTAATLACNLVPMEIRSAVAFMTAHLYETREPIVTGRSETAIEIPGTVDSMLEPYKYRETG